MNIAIMDNNGIIEDGFLNADDAINALDRVREENQDIEGDLKVIEIHKSGYKPYKAPIDMSGYIGKDISIRLKNRRFVEQISR